MLALLSGCRRTEEPPPPDIRPVRTLEEEVRADPVVQALMRSSVLELADVRPLDEDDAE